MNDNSNLRIIYGGRAEEKIADAKPLYSAGEALTEASRCLYCYDAPCIRACPTGIDIPTFIKKIATGNLRGAARTILNANLLGYSCGAVCPVEVLCVGSCVYNNWDAPPIQIGRLQRYATAAVLDDGYQPFTVAERLPRHVALVGAGPASLSCAGVLALGGVAATVFEARPLAGGLNTTGVAPYKMQVWESLKEVEFIKRLGVEVRAGAVVGRDISAEHLLAEYDAVFIGVGLGWDRQLGIPGVDGPGVIGATQWIERLKTDPDFKLDPVRRAVVIGGGNTALDVAQELSLLGVREVLLVYRRSQGEMSGYRHELDHALKRGAQLVENTVPLAIIRNSSGHVAALRCCRLVDGRAPEDFWADVPCDLVIVAIGQDRLAELAALFPGVQVRSGCIVTDPDTGRTANPKVFAGGDCVNGGKEVVNAVQDGKLAARAMLAQWRAEAEAALCGAAAPPRR